MATDFLRILQEVRGTLGPDEIYTDGIYWDLTISDHSTFPGKYGHMLHMYNVVAPLEDNIQLILDNTPIIQDVSDNMVDINKVAAVDTEISRLALSIAAIDSLYADKITLDSLFADKPTLDGLFVSKSAIDSLFIDKPTLDSLYTDKVTLDTVFATKDNIDLVGASIVDVNTAAANIVDIQNAEENALSAKLSKWVAEASMMTADSYATETEDVVVKIYTSNGDGTFTVTPTTEYSSQHWQIKADAAIAGNEEILGTNGGLVRYDKVLSNIPILRIVYGASDIILQVIYVGDDGSDDGTTGTNFVRSQLGYTGVDLIEVKYFYGTVNLTTASGTTALTYVSNQLDTTSYTE